MMDPRLFDNIPEQPDWFEIACRVIVGGVLLVVAVMVVWG